MNEHKEWSWERKFNPFNSDKLLAQIERWQYINLEDPINIIPHPVTISIDPTNLCNLKCSWCNADYILKNRKNSLSLELLLKLGEMLSTWTNNPYFTPGVRSICIGGGGEPLINPNIGKFIDFLTGKGIKVGVVTNGTRIDEYIPNLAKCTWVGVSVDCGESETFEKLKGRKLFYQVIDNMRNLVSYAKVNNTKLARINSPGYGVTYKYLLHPENVREIFRATEIAKTIGCKQIHIRPCASSWDKLDQPITFNYYMQQTFYNETNRARRFFEDDSFGVYGITHKVDDDLVPRIEFKKCYAVFMTAVVMPGEIPDTYSVSLCCDRRGDRSLELVSDSVYVNDLPRLWGNEKHRKIFNQINLKCCPRCTYQPHNQIFEQVILNDSMTWEFI